MYEEQDIVIGNDCGRFVVSVKVGMGSEDMVTLPVAVWNYGAIVSALIRYKYSESEVEAIVSNSLMLICIKFNTIDFKLPSVCIFILFFALR